MTKTKCFIIHFNRPTFLARQLEVLSKNNSLEIIVIDNCSDPKKKESAENNCMAYNIKFLGLKENYGHTVVWSQGLSEKYAPNERYVVTDCDVIPPDCDYMKVLNEGLDQNPHIKKVGLELNISRIPDNYPKRDEVVNHEKRVLYRKGLKSKNFVECAVDTTFALYREGYHNYSVWGTNTNEWEGKCFSLRTRRIEADHLGWHVTPPYDKETEMYFDSIKNENTGHWKI